MMCTQVRFCVWHATLLLCIYVWDGNHLPFFLCYRLCNMTLFYVASPESLLRAVRNKYIKAAALIVFNNINYMFIAGR